MFWNKRNNDSLPYISMNPFDAEKIINSYGSALSVGTSGIARPESLLPYSKARIKYAYFVYLENIIKQGLLSQEIGDNLVNTYSSLAFFIEDDECDEINNTSKLIKNKTLDYNIPDNKINFDKFKDFTQKYLYLSQEYQKEIYDFILECYKKK